jgi:hypothetical protein
MAFRPRLGIANVGIANVWIASVLAVQLAPAIARAEPTSADRETARVLMQQGRELRNKGDLKEALKRFMGADEIMHVPTTALEVARAEVAMGLLVEARDAISAIRLNPSKPNEPAPFKDARTQADALDASLNGRIPGLTITVTGAPAGETPSVSVDGAPLPAGVIGLLRTVDPGHHVVVAKTAHGEGKAEVDVREGEQKPVEIALVITESPNSETPSPSESAPETPPPSTRSHAPTVLTWLGIGLAGAGVAVGSVGGALSLSKTSSLKSQCTSNVCGPSLYSQYDTANMFATVSTIGFIAAGVGAAVAVVTLIVGHDTTSAEPAAPPAGVARGQGVVVHPWVSLGAGGVAGSF